MVDKMNSQNPSQHSSWKPARRRQICMQIAAGVLIFLSGIIVGSGGTVLWVKDRIAWIRPPRERSMVSDMVERFKAEYNLTEEQALQVKKVFQEAIQTRMSIYEEAAQKLQKNEKTLDAKMKEILSAEQYKRWVSDFRTRKERFERFGPFGPRWLGPEGPGLGRPGPERPGPGGPRKFGPARPEPNRPGPDG